MIYYREKVDDPSQGGFFDFTFSEDSLGYDVVESQVREKVAALLAVGVRSLQVTYDYSPEEMVLRASVEWGDQVGRASRGELGPEAG